MSEDYEFETYTFGERVHFDRGFRAVVVEDGDDDVRLVFDDGSMGWHPKGDDLIRGWRGACGLDQGDGGEE